MIRDLQMMKDISPLYDKKLIIWGMGKKGRQILADILEMGAGKKGILLCDSDSSLQGEELFDYIVFSPEALYEKIKDATKEDMAILVTAGSTMAQDEIIKEAEKMCGESVDIYTEYALEWGIYLGLKNPNIEKEYKKKSFMNMKNVCCIKGMLWNKWREHINILLFCHCIMTKLFSYTNLGRWVRRQFTKVFRDMAGMFYIVTGWKTLERMVIVCAGF